MKRIRRREILIEKESIKFYAKNASENYPVCGICEGEQVMVSPTIIAGILQISSREIYKWIETEKVHFVEDEFFQIYICTNSLANFFRKKKLLN